MARHRPEGWRLIPPKSRISEAAETHSLESLTSSQLVFLAESDATLFASLDEEVALHRAVRCFVPFLADCSILVIPESASKVRRLGASAFPSLASYIESRIYERQLWEDSRPEIAHDIPESWYAVLSANNQETEKLRAAGFHSAMRLPLTLRGTRFGTLSLLSGTRAFTERDMVLALAVSRRAVLAIENAREHARALSQTVGPTQTGLAVLAHELRNLISPIAGWARIFRGNPSIQHDAILREGAESLDRNARHMARLVDDCLDLSSVTEGALRLQLSTVDLNAVVRAAIDDLKDSIKDKQHVLGVDLSNAPAWVEGDRARLQQVAANILTNAVKFCDPGGRIAVLSRALHGEIVLDVCDNGRGIDPEDLPRIFEPFYRGTDSASGGLGLGLAISRQIVSLHGGTIAAESAGLGKGCTVRLRLPRSRTLHAAILPEEPKRASKCRHILVVEDASDVRALMKLQIESMGHSVAVSANAREAIAQARLHHPDLIISDVRMSNGDGYALARLIRSDPTTKSIPLLGITGLSHTAAGRELTLAGFDACLLKPVEDEDLYYWIDRLTRGR